MSQQIRVLQCIECKMFQVDLVKKAIKWECKICRQKQGLLKEFFRGSGPECRAKVQQMNLERGKQEEHIEENLFLTAQQRVQDQEDGSLEGQEKKLEPPPKKIKNKWADYVDESIPVPQKSAERPKEVADIKDELNDGIGTSKSTKRPAQSVVTSLSNKSSKWSNYI